MAFTQQSSICFAMDFSKYLGFPIFHMRMKKADFNFLLEKISKRLASWKEKLLNRAGRISLANSIVSFIPIYTI
ncbi:hypothetical protein Peur_067120 [Populus x canadensis]